VTIGAGVVEYSSNIILNDLYVKYFKEANKYVNKKYSYIHFFIYQFLVSLYHLLNETGLKKII
jgi:hypothetical protein